MNAGASTMVVGRALRPQLRVRPPLRDGWRLRSELPGGRLAHICLNKRGHRVGSHIVRWTALGARSEAASQRGKRRQGNWCSAGCEIASLLHQRLPSMRMLQGGSCVALACDCGRGQRALECVMVCLGGWGRTESRECRRTLVLRMAMGRQREPTRATGRSGQGRRWPLADTPGLLGPQREAQGRGEAKAEAGGRSAKGQTKKAKLQAAPPVSLANSRLVGILWGPSDQRRK